eukprot:Nk52_evm38s343 gene=Nk52_evmTU38s343
MWMWMGRAAAGGGGVAYITVGVSGKGVFHSMCNRLDYVGSGGLKSLGAWAMGQTCSNLNNGIKNTKLFHSRASGYNIFAAKSESLRKGLSNVKVGDKTRSLWTGRRDMTMEDGLKRVFNGISKRSFSLMTRNGGGFEFHNPKHVTYAIIGCNSVVFLLWQYGFMRQRQLRKSDLLDFLSKHFTCSLANIEALRLHTLVTYSLTYTEPLRFGLSMFFLYSMSEPIMSFVGVRPFVTAYILGNIGGALMTLAYKYDQLPESGKRNFRNSFFISSIKNSPITGASGGIMATASLYAVLYPQSSIMLFFVLPVPPILIVSGIFALDAYKMAFGNGADKNAGVYVGGCSSAAFYILFSRYRKFGRFFR